jgi:chromosomal replication initiation ATPase DnaA
MVPIGHHANAIAVARVFAAEASAQLSLLLVLGPTGVGKTELVQQLVPELSAGGCRRCAVLAGRDVVADLVEAIRTNALHQIASRFGRSDVVVIEDVGDLRHRPAAQGELGTLIAGWVAAGARVVCSAGCSLQALTEFERRLPPPPASCVVALPKPTRREMRAALKSLAAAASISIDEQSLSELAAWCNGDIRRAVGAVRRLRFEGRYAQSRGSDKERLERHAPLSSSTQSRPYARAWCRGLDTRRRVAMSRR